MLNFKKKKAKKVSVVNMVIGAVVGVITYRFGKPAIKAMPKIFNSGKLIAIKGFNMIKSNFSKFLKKPIV